MDELKIEDLFKGWQTCIQTPDYPCKSVSIYLCTSGEDMVEERKCIMKSIVPQMKTMCSKLGLDFDLHDLVIDQVADVIKMHCDSFEVCQHAIKTSQMFSAGPNFIVLAGDKYGEFSFPKTIPQEEFEILYNLLKEENCSTDFLDQWFKQDQNSVPVNYVLRHISEFVGEADPKESYRKWVWHRKKLSTLLSKAARIAQDRGALPAEETGKYLSSVLEKEISTGLLETDDSLEKCLCFVRRFQDIQQHSLVQDDNNIDIYMDIGMDDAQRTVLKDRLNLHYNGTLKNRLPKSCFYTFEVPWLQGGISPANQNHKTYLKDLTETMHIALQDAVHHSLDRLRLKGDGTLENEVRYHSKLLCQISNSFLGRKDVIDSLKLKLKRNWESDAKTPLLIHGVSGCGKTFLIAKLIKDVREWMNVSNLVIIYRFLGKTEHSTDLFKLLKSICQQICEMYNLQQFWNTAYSSLLQTITFFHALLAELKSHDHPLLIVLDGLDHLENEAFQNSLNNWLPRKLHENCRIVLSTEANVKNIQRNYSSYYQENSGSTNSKKNHLKKRNSLSNGTSISSLRKLLTKRKSSKISPRLAQDILNRNREDTPPSSNMTSSTIDIQDKQLFAISREPTNDMLLVGRESTITFDKNGSDDVSYQQHHLFKLSDTLSYDDRNAMFDHLLTSKNRKLTQNQSDYIKSCMENCPQPLYISLIVRYAVQWHSYDDCATLALPMSSSEMVEYLLQDLEKKCGGGLVVHALSYITLSSFGLTESQLIDILSLDGVVLNEAFDHAKPLQKLAVRLPSFLWKRLRFYLEDILEERNRDGYYVLKWSHRTFERVARNRYLRNEEKTKYLCKILLEYFLGTYSSDGQFKQTIINKNNRKKVKCNLHQFTLQPIQYSKNLYNTRRMIELPNLFVKTSNYKMLFSRVLFNFDWLAQKIEALGIRDAISDYDEFLQGSYSFEVEFVKKVLKIYAGSIEKNDKSVGNILLNALQKLNLKIYPNLKNLFDEIQAQLYSTKHPLLFLQDQQIVQSHDQLPKTTIQQPGKIKFVKFFHHQENTGKPERKIVCISHNNNTMFITFYDLKDLSLIRCLTMPTEVTAPLIFMSGDCSYLAIGLDELHFFETSSMTLVRCIVKQQTYAVCIQENEDGSLIAIGYKNGLIQVLECGSFNVIAEVATSCSSMTTIFCLSFSTELLLVPYSENTFAILDYEKTDINQIHITDDQEQIDPKSPVCFSNPHEILLYATDSNIHSFDVSKRSKAFTFSDHTSNVTKLKMLSDDLFVSSDEDGVVKIWHLKKELIMHTLQNHHGCIRFINYCKMQNTLITTGSDDLTNVWDLSLSSLKNTFITGDVSCIDVHLSSDLLATGANDKELKIHEIDNEQDANTTDKISSCIHLELSPSEAYAVVIQDAANTILWDIHSNKVSWEFKGNATCTCFATNSNCLIGTESGEMHLFQIEQKNVRSTILKVFDHKPISNIKLFGDDKVFILSTDGSLFTYDFVNRKVLQKFKPHQKKVTEVLLKNSFLLLGSQDCNVTLFHKHTAHLSILHSFAGSESPIVCLALLEELNHVIAGNQSGSILIWDMKSGDNLQDLSFSINGVNCILGNDLSTKLLIGGNSDERQLREVGYTRPDDVRYLSGHKGGITNLVLTECMQFIVTSSCDGTLIIWDNTTKKEIDSFRLSSKIERITLSKIQEGSFYAIYVITRSRSLHILHLNFKPRRNKIHKFTGDGHLIMLNDGNEVNVKHRVKQKKCCQIS